MKVFGAIIIVIGCLLILGFLGYEIFSLVRDIRKAINKKKAQKLENTKDKEN